MIAVTGKAAEYAEAIEKLKALYGVQDQPLSEEEQGEFILLSAFFNLSKETRHYLSVYLQLMGMSVTINNFRPLKDALVQAYKDLKEARKPWEA